MYGGNACDFVHGFVCVDVCGWWVGVFVGVCVI